MDKEQRRAYNKFYRECHAERIEANQSRKVTCEYCGRCVRYQNLKSHKKTKYCMNHCTHAIGVNVEKIIKLVKDQIESDRLINRPATGSL